jgi:DNA polymerase-1
VLTGLFGFFALLRVAIRDELPVPPEIIVAFDGEHGGAARRAADGDYKAQRPTDAAALAPLAHLPGVQAGLDHCGIAWVEIDDAEADDVIATLVQAAGLDRTILVMSNDRDFYQLVGGRVCVLNTAMRPGARRIGAAEVAGRYRVSPAQWPDFRALTGDPADNIPGVRGVGAKTAAALLAGGLTLADLPESGRLATCRGGPAVRAAWPQVCTWRDMISLRADVPLPLKPVGEPSPPLPTPAEVVAALGLW